MAKTCIAPRCKNDAKSPHAKFCTVCFKRNARSANLKRKRFAGGGGVLGNAGGYGVLGNRGNRHGSGVLVTVATSVVVESLATVATLHLDIVWLLSRAACGARRRTRSGQARPRRHPPQQKIASRKRVKPKTKPGQRPKARRQPSQC